MSVIAVTGSEGDIGRVISSYLEEKGHTVVRGTHSNCDVTHQDSVCQFFEKAWELHGCLHGLVNAVGSPGCIGPSEVVPLSRFRETLSVHVTGMFTTCSMAFPYLLGKGAIVNLSSIHAVATYPGRAAYAAATAGVVGFTKSIAIEWAKEGIQVNCVAPGQVLETRRTANVMSQALLDRIPSGRLVEPRNVARAVEFLLTPDLQITGQTIVVDDGLTSSAYWGTHVDGV